jgi:hypothetical protein
LAISMRLASGLADGWYGVWSYRARLQSEAHDSRTGGRLSVAPLFAASRKIGAMQIIPPFRMMPFEQVEPGDLFLYTEERHKFYSLRTQSPSNGPGLRWSRSARHSWTMLRSHFFFPGKPQWCRRLGKISPSCCQLTQELGHGTVQTERRSRWGWRAIAYLFAQTAAHLRTNTFLVLLISRLVKSSNVLCQEHQYTPAHGKLRFWSLIIHPVRF